MTRRYPDVLDPQGTYPPTEDMLAEPVPQEVQEAQKKRLRAAWKTPQGWRYWSAVNNTEVDEAMPVLQAK